MKTQKQPKPRSRHIDETSYNENPYQINERRNNKEYYFSTPVTAENKALPAYLYLEKCAKIAGANSFVFISRRFHVK